MIKIQYAVARIVATLLNGLGVLKNGQVIEADRGALVAGYSGQTAIKTAAVVRSALGGVLFVDEVSLEIYISIKMPMQ